MTDPRRPAVPDRPHDVESTRVDNLATAHRPEPLRWVHRCRSCGYQGAEPPPPPCPGPSYRQTALDLGYADLMVAAGFTPNPDRPEPPGWGRGTDEYLIPPWRTHHLRRHAADLWATPLTDLREALTDLGRATIHVAYDAARAALALLRDPR